MNRLSYSGRFVRVVCVVVNVQALKNILGFGYMKARVDVLF